MEIVKLAALGIVAVVIILLVRQLKPEIAVVISVAFSVLFITLILEDLFAVVYAFYSLADKTGIEQKSLFSVVRIIGIGYLTEFSNTICEEANCKGIGDKVMLAGKIAIVLIALPIITNVFAIVLELVP